MIKQHRTVNMRRAKVAGCHLLQSVPVGAFPSAVLGVIGVRLRGEGSGKICGETETQ